MHLHITTSYTRGAFLGFYRIFTMLENLDALERAYQNHWILSTSQLAEVLGVAGKTLSRLPEFDRHGFHFSRNGEVGNEIGWTISKVVKSTRKAK